MLQRTFIHVPGLGAHTEKSLWQQGCTSWSKYLSDPEGYNVGGSSRQQLTTTLESSHRALTDRNHQYFSRSLGAKESWRAWREFKTSCVYLDIETDGGASGSNVTCVGLYDGTAFRCLVKDQDLSYFPDIISHYGMIVTFFGTGFDIPMLMRSFPGFHFDHIHLDLCHTLKRLGFRGGLKKIERQLGISRGEDTVGLNGQDAIRLWREYLRGHDRSLEQLIAYNRDDVVNLETLAELAYTRLEAQTLTEAGVRHLLEGQESLF